jgi:hypothetical protein
MRKVTSQIARALDNGKRMSVGNTMCNGTEVYLHGNLIAYLSDSRTKLNLTLAGWNTPTTRERVNGIAEHFGLKGRFRQMDWEPYYEGNLIEADDTITIDLLLDESYQ